MLDKVRLTDKLATFDDAWAPRIVAELNGQMVKVAKFRGPYVWHAHEAEDELFWVVAGRLRIELRDGVVELGPGELVVVPRGVEHRPVAEDEVHVVLFEPATTVTTGDADSDLRIDPKDLGRA